MTARAQANDLIVSDEQPTRKLSGAMAWMACGAGVRAVGAGALLDAVFDRHHRLSRGVPWVSCWRLRFLLYPAWEKSKYRDRVWIVDWLLALIGMAALVYLATHIEEVKTRATRPLELEVWLGAGLILCILEATRRTTGWVLPFVTLVFLGYALGGALYAGAAWTIAAIRSRGSSGRII